MNITRLHELLSATSILLRKGEVVEQKTIAPGVEVITVDFMPPVDAAKPELTLVDLELVVVGVHPTNAERYRTELIELLQTYPKPQRLRAGPSYIEVGAEIGDQGAALQLFALGKVLGLWDVVTPHTLGVVGNTATEMAGLGFVMMTGFPRVAAEGASGL